MNDLFEPIPVQQPESYTLPEGGKTPINEKVAWRAGSASPALIVPGENGETHLIALAGLVDTKLGQVGKRRWNDFWGLGNLFVHQEKGKLVVQNNPQIEEAKGRNLKVERINSPKEKEEIKGETRCFNLPWGQSIKVGGLLIERDKKNRAIVTSTNRVKCSEELKRGRGQLRLAQMRVGEQCTINILGENGREVIIINDHGGGTTIEPVAPSSKKAPEPIQAAPEVIQPQPKLDLELKEYAGYGLTWAGQTHRGQVRKTNQDAFRLPDRGLGELAKTKGLLYLVADGMGGHQGGETASRMTAEIVEREHYQCASNDIQECLIQAVAAANSAIYNASQSDRELRGMGSTITAAIIHGDNLYVANVGDSRGYLSRGEEIKQLTRDHSYVQQLVEQGTITEEQARAHQDRNVITRSLGGKGYINCQKRITRQIGNRQYLEIDDFIDVFTERIYPNNQLILCTDGETNYVTDEEINREIQQTPSLSSAVKNLMTMAYQRGGHDNITLLAVGKNQ